jgi:osmotically-inducible protein OsmY
MKGDVQIQADVLRELQWDSRAGAANVGVTVNAGVVTLKGTAYSYAAQQAALEAARRVQGVLDVVSEIKVKIPGPSARGDVEIAQAVQRALEWDVLVPDEQIRISVTDGWVTLTGEVGRRHEADDAERAVRHLAGVRGVTNRIVVSDAHADPAQLRHAIEAALQRRVAEEARRVVVGVQDGTVTLSGAVATWDEKRAMLEAAVHAPGVQKVEDRLRIDEASGRPAQLASR